MLLEVISARYIDGYKIFLEFNDGCKAIVDLEKTILNEKRKIFLPLRDKEYFKDFSIKFNTICWKNEADFAPEFLHDLAVSEAPQGTDSISCRKNICETKVSD